MEGGGSIAEHMNKIDENTKGQTKATEVFGLKATPEQLEHEISFQRYDQASGPVHEVVLGSNRCATIF